MALKEQRTFKFPNMVNLNTGKTELVSQEASISTCLGLLLRTSPGELFGDPFFGSRLTEYLFDPNRDALQDIIQEEIFSAAEKYEPRARITGINFYVDEYKENILHVSITYINRNTGITEVFRDALNLNDIDYEYDDIVSNN